MQVIGNENIVKHRQKKAPYTKIQRKERRDEVYRPHFDTGMSATRIAEMMKVDRNTINDLKILYRKAIKEYNPDMTLDDIVEKQLLRLETQRDRLGLYLFDAKDINSKLAVERLIAYIDFKVIGVIEKMDQNIVQHWNAVMEQVNKMAEKENLKTRFTSLFELYRISIDTRKISINLEKKYDVNYKNIKNKRKKKKYNDKQGNEII